MKLAEEPMTSSERRRLALAGVACAAAFVFGWSIVAPYIAWAASIVDQIRALF